VILLSSKFLEFKSKRNNCLPSFELNAEIAVRFHDIFTLKLIILNTHDLTVKEVLDTNVLLFSEEKLY
jgi:hypothetical protein